MTKPAVCDYEDDLWVRFIVAVMRDRLEPRSLAFKVQNRSKG